MRDEHNTFNDEHDENVQRPLNTSGFGGSGFGNSDEYAVVEPAKKSVSSGTIVIVLVVLLAAGGLWSMRSLAIAMAGSSVDKSLEKTIESFLDSLAGGGTANQTNTEVLTVGENDARTVLVDDRTEKQVALTDVQKNPFAFERRESAPVAAPQDDAGREQERLAAARQARIDQFEGAAARLRLLMILGGSNPMANVSGRVVHVDDIIVDDRSKVEFTVKEISDTFVTLVAVDPSLNLEHEVVLRLHRNR